MPRFSETLPFFLALASLPEHIRTNAFTSSSQNGRRSRTSGERHFDGRRIALDEEVLEGPFVRRHERSTPQEDGPPEEEVFNPYLNNLGISHRLPMHQRPLKNRGANTGLNPSDVLGGNNMPRSPAQSGSYMDRTSEVTPGYNNGQQQQSYDAQVPGSQYDDRASSDLYSAPENNVRNDQAGYNTAANVPDDSLNGGGAASSPAFYPNDTSGNDVLDAVAQPFDASTDAGYDAPDSYTFNNGSSSDGQERLDAPPQERLPLDYNNNNVRGNPSINPNRNNMNERRNRPPSNPFNPPSRPNFHGVTSAPFSFAKDAGASYWNELSYVERQREQNRLAEEQARRQKIEQEARIAHERRKREEAQKMEAARIAQEAARLEEEKRKIEQQQRAEAERLAKEAEKLEEEKRNERRKREEAQRLEAERLAAEKALLEEEKRLFEEKQKAEAYRLREEAAKVEAERQRMAEAQARAIEEERKRWQEEEDRLARIAKEEAARAVEAERQRQQEEQDRITMKLVEEQKLAEELRVANEKRQLEEARLETEKQRRQEEEYSIMMKLAEEQKLAEELRVANDKRQLEEARLEAEKQRRKEEIDRIAAADATKTAEQERLAEELRLAEEKLENARLAATPEADAGPPVTPDDSANKADFGSGSGGAPEKSLTPLEKKYAVDAVRAASSENDTNLDAESRLLEEARLAEASLVEEKRKIELAKTEYIRKFEERLANEAMKAEASLLEEKRKAQESNGSELADENQNVADGPHLASNDSATKTEAGSADTGSDADEENTRTPEAAFPEIDESLKVSVTPKQDGTSPVKALTPLERKYASESPQGNSLDKKTKSDKPTAPQTRSEMEDEEEESSLEPLPPKMPPPAFEKSRSVSYSVNTKGGSSSPSVPKRSIEVPRKVAPTMAETTGLVKRIQQRDRLGQGKAGVLVDENGLTLEERIASTITEATKGIVVTKRTYETTRENLRYFKSNTQRRLSRSAREKDKAAEKVADIKVRMQEKIRTVEEQLEATLNKTQDKIDEEVSRIVDLLVSEIELEVQRQEDMVQLMDSLQDMVAAKECDIAEDKNIANEMIDVRSKLKNGLIAENLDKEVEQKLSVAAIDQELVNDLFGCLIDLQNLLEDAQDRATRTSQALDDFVRPETSASKPYDWSDIEAMELVFEQAADNVAAAEERIRELSERIDGALVDKALVLGEDVPPGLAKLAQKAAKRGSIKKAIISADIDLEMDLEGVMELQGKDEKELLSMLGKSVGSATVDGSKAAAYGLKSIFDSVTGKPVGDTARQTGDGIENDEGESRAIVSSTDSTDIEPASKGGSSHSDSSRAASEALEETTKGLLDSLKAAAALSVKMFRGQG